MKFVYDDGGRSAAGYKGITGDCVTRSIAIATGIDYQIVYDALNEIAKNERRGKRKRGISSARSGVYRGTYHKYLLSIGYKWVPCMFIGKGCQVHMREQELPGHARLIISLSKHMTAVIDGVIHDLENPDRDGMRCVYGYYIKE